MTKTEICNQALDHIGDSALISSLADGTIQSQALNRHYDTALDSLLEESDWSFARRSQALALIAGEDPTVYSRFNLAYAYPSDCLVAIRIYNEGSISSVDKIEFQLYTPSAKNAIYILTDQEDAFLEFTAAVDDFTVLKSAMFQRALSHTLASMVAVPLIKGEKGRQLRDDNLNMAFGIGGQAKNKSKNEGHKDVKNYSGYKKSML